MTTILSYEGGLKIHMRYGSDGEVETRGKRLFFPDGLCCDRSYQSISVTGITPTLAGLVVPFNVNQTIATVPASQTLSWVTVTSSNNSGNITINKTGDYYIWARFRETTPVPVNSGLLRMALRDSTSTVDEQVGSVYAVVGQVQTQVVDVKAFRKYNAGTILNVRSYWYDLTAGSGANPPVGTVDINIYRLG